MAKISKLEKVKDGPDFVFFCPGCQCEHGVWTTESNNNNAIWNFNGDMEKPTISPSLLIRHGKDVVCHSIITDGNINFCTDSNHHLSGKTIELPEFNN